MNSYLPLNSSRYLASFSLGSKRGDRRVSRRLPCKKALTRNSLRSKIIRLKEVLTGIGCEEQYYMTSYWLLSSSCHLVSPRLRCSPFVCLLLIRLLGVLAARWSPDHLLSSWLLNAVPGRVPDSSTRVLLALGALLSAQRPPCRPSPFWLFGTALTTHNHD